MTERIRTYREEPERTEIINDDADSGTSKLQQLVYVLTGILVGLLGLRVLLSLLGANPGNAFADLIYGLSHPFVAPFFGLFGYTFERGIARLELETLFAIVVYMLIGWAIISVLDVNRKDRRHYHST